jgi:hypothetical protein
MRGNQSAKGLNVLNERMRTLLICHEGALLAQEGLARWLNSFTELVGVMVVRETVERTKQRIRTQLKRVGPARFLDVLAFRLYYKLFLERRDAEWESRKLAELSNLYPEVRGIATLVTHSPNTAEAEQFIATQRPDIMIARCKTLLNENIFSLPKAGTFVMHPGICPEYRNSHGCFWALAQGDKKKVGMTLLRIDRGVDTGSIYGYFGYPYDEVRESHVVIQARVVLDNLPNIAKKLSETYVGEAEPLETTGRPSRTWGQPWLTSDLRWKRRARRELASEGKT